MNTTRRYLCEALSFQYRYIPIGLLEHLPGRINDRAPAFSARSDLGEWICNLIEEANGVQKLCFRVEIVETGSRSLRCFWGEPLSPGFLYRSIKVTHMRVKVNYVDSFRI